MVYSRRDIIPIMIKKKFPKPQKVPSCQTPTQNQTTTALTSITMDYFYLLLNSACILLCGTSFAGHNVSKIGSTGHSRSVSVKMLASGKDVQENVRGVQ